MAYSLRLTEDRVAAGASPPASRRGVPRVLFVLAGTHQDGAAGAPVPAVGPNHDEARAGSDGARL